MSVTSKLPVLQAMWLQCSRSGGFDAVFKKVILIGLILELHIEILGCPGETFEWRRGEMRSRIHCGKRTHKFYGSAYPEHPNYASVSLVRL